MIYFHYDLNYVTNNDIIRFRVLISVDKITHDLLQTYKQCISKPDLKCLHDTQAGEEILRINKKKIIYLFIIFVDYELPVKELNSCFVFLGLKFFLRSVSSKTNGTIYPLFFNILKYFWVQNI